MLYHFDPCKVDTIDKISKATYIRLIRKYIDENARDKLYKITHKFYQSSHWKETRAVVLKRDNYICLYCYERANIVHHHYRLIENPELAFRKQYLESVCARCHDIIHNRSKVNARISSPNSS